MYRIGVDDGSFELVGSEQTIAGSPGVQALGAFTLNNTAYAILESSLSSLARVRIFQVNQLLGILTQVGADQTLPTIGANHGNINGIGAFVLNDTVYVTVSARRVFPAVIREFLFTMDSTDYSFTYVGELVFGGEENRGAFVLNDVAYVLAQRGGSRYVLYQLDVDTLSVTAVGPVSISVGDQGVGAFAYQDAAYAVIMSGIATFRFFGVNTNNGVLTEIGSEQTIAGFGDIRGIGAFVL